MIVRARVGGIDWPQNLTRRLDTRRGRRICGTSPVFKTRPALNREVLIARTRLCWSPGTLFWHHKTQAQNGKNGSYARLLVLYFRGSDTTDQTSAVEGHINGSFSRRLRNLFRASPTHTHTTSWTEGLNTERLLRRLPFIDYLRISA